MDTASPPQKIDIEPTKDVFGVTILPNDREQKQRCLLACFGKGGYLFWPGKDQPVEHEGIALKIGKNANCIVTVTPSAREIKAE